MKAAQWDTLRDWLEEHHLKTDGSVPPTRLAGGSQNRLYRINGPQRHYVLRCGPRHPRPQTNATLEREVRVLTALDGTDVPHARVLAVCLDDALLGGVFYVAEWIDGFNPSVALPEIHAADPPVRHDMGLAAAAVLASLGAVDHAAIGLGGLGRPEGFLERQVPRWLDELDSYGRFPGYVGHQFRGIDRVADWLDANRPRSWSPGLVHGDYHLANLMYALDGSRVVAVVDWEMATVGDPLLDLGLLLATWPDGQHENPIAGAYGNAPGYPPADELIRRYGEGSDRDLSALAWYEVLARFKFGILLEGTYARACAGKAPQTTGALLRSIAVEMIDTALATVARR